MLVRYSTNTLWKKMKRKLTSGFFSYPRLDLVVLDKMTKTSWYNAHLQAHNQQSKSKKNQGSMLIKVVPLRVLLRTLSQHSSRVFSFPRL